MEGKIKIVLWRLENIPTRAENAEDGSHAEFKTTPIEPFDPTIVRPSAFYDYRYAHDYLYEHHPYNALVSLCRVEGNRL